MIKAWKLLKSDIEAAWWDIPAGIRIFLSFVIIFAITAILVSIANLIMNLAGIEFQRCYKIRFNDGLHEYCTSG